MHAFQKLLKITNTPLLRDIQRRKPNSRMTAVRSQCSGFFELWVGFEVSDGGLATAFVPGCEVDEEGAGGGGGGGVLQG